MDSGGVRAQIIAATTPSLAKGERVRCCSPVWVTECGGRMPLLVRRRFLHYVAVTGRRLILFRAPQPGHRLSPTDMLVAKRLSAFSLVRKRRFSQTLQLQIRGVGGRELLFEFRARDRSVGQDLAAAFVLASFLEDLPDS